MRSKLVTLFYISGIYFFAMLHRVAVPGAVFDQLQGTFGVPAATVAALGSVYLYVYGGMQLLSGALSDKLGPSRMLISGALLLSAGSLLFPLPDSIFLLYSARALVGLGSSFVFISMMKHVNTNFSPENFPLVFSAAMAAGYAGGLAGTLPFERLSFYLGWRGAFLAAGFACLALSSGAVFRLRKTLVCSDCSFTLPAMRAAVLNRRIYPVIVSGSSNFSVYFIILATAGKKMLEDAAGMSSSSAAAFTFALMSSSAASLLVHGYLGKKTGKRKIFSVASGASCLAGGILILANLAWGKNPAVFFTGYVLCGWAGGNMLNPTLVKEMSPEFSAGTSVGLFSTAMFISVAASGHVSGKIMDVFTPVLSGDRLVYPDGAYISIFVFCIILGIISLAAAALIQKPGVYRAVPGRS